MYSSMQKECRINSKRIYAAFAMLAEDEGHTLGQVGREQRVDVVIRRGVEDGGQRGTSLGFRGFPPASAAGKISSCKGVMNFPYPYIVFTHGNIHFENTVGIYSNALAVKFHIKNHNVRCI